MLSHNAVFLLYMNSTFCRIHEVELLQVEMESTPHCIFQHQSECLVHTSL